MEEIKLKNIYFGRADGSQEAEDENFENLFYKGNKKYDLLNKNIDKFIISGRHNKERISRKCIFFC